jgi:hypothetical protein
VDATWASKVPFSWIEAIQDALSDYNPFAHASFYLADIDPVLCLTAHIRLDPTRSGSEFVAIMNFDNTTLGDVNTRKLIIVQHNGN